MSEMVAIVVFVLRAVWHVLPAFVLSIALAVFIRALGLDGMIRRAFDARVGLAIVLATAVGAFSPLCSCTVIPVVSGLLMAGVPLAPVMSFWIASPTMDPEMFALTVATLGWPLAVVRLLATLVLSLGAGVVTLVLTRSGVLSGELLRVARPKPAARLPLLAVGTLRPVLTGASVIAGGSGASAGASCCAPAAPLGAGSCCASAAPAAASSCCTPPAEAASGSLGAFLRERVGAISWPLFARQMGVEGYRLGRWLVLAFVLEALILRYVPQAAIASVLGTGSLYAVPLAALVGIPLYLNNVSALPIVSGLLAQGIQPGAAIAFLIAGPVTTVPAMSAVWGIARPRVFALYAGIALAGAIVLGALTNLLLG